MNLAERFGWTYEYIDNIDHWELERTLAIIDARERAKAPRKDS